MAQVKYFVSIYLLLVIPRKLLTITGEVIKSPPITDWGQWGSMQNCAKDTVVQGFQLKTAGYVGPFYDDTALNGVRFYCGNLLNDDDTITSSVGSWGKWGNVFSCGNGAIVGFQLRVEAFDVIDFDETATNNVRFFCSNMEEDRHIEGDGENSGLWRGSVRCPSRQVICGIQTQIQPDRGLLDDTAMNNLAAECCPVPANIEYKL